MNRRMSRKTPVLYKGQPLMSSRPLISSPPITSSPPPPSSPSSPSPSPSSLPPPPPHFKCHYHPHCPSLQPLSRALPPAASVDSKAHSFTTAWITQQSKDLGSQATKSQTRPQGQAASKDNGRKRFRSAGAHGSASKKAERH